MSGSAAPPGARTVVRVGSEGELAERAHAWLVAALESLLGEAGHGAPRVVLPAGRTPLPLYERLVADPHARALLRRCEFWQLDEYVHGHDRSGAAVPGAAGGGSGRPTFHAWLTRVLYGPAGVPPERVRRLPADAPDIEAAARAHARALRAAGGIDVAVLGLGRNGHVGFNEPGTPFDAPVHLARLRPETLAANRAYWTDAAADEAARPGTDRVEVPPFGITLGLSDLRDAARILLLVPRDRAGLALRGLAMAPDPEVPVSALQVARDLTALIET